VVAAWKASGTKLTELYASWAQEDDVSKDLNKAGMQALA
jgi:hypothetical protein